MMRILQQSIVKILLSFGLLNLSLFAYSDSDFDGVSDSKDLCPNTSFDAMVDHNGCPKSKNITLLLGEELSSGTYGGTESVTTDRTTAYIAYNKGLWAYSVSGSTSSTASTTSITSGVGDIYTSLSYHGLGTKDRLLSLQVGAKIATADLELGTGENDYNIRLSSVKMDKTLSYLSSIGYTMTGDSSTISYNELVSVSLGLGQQVNKAFYLSASVNYASAYIEGADESMSLTAYLAYAPSDTWFVTSSYTLGLSDAVADHSVNLSIGAKL